MPSSQWLETDYVPDRRGRSGLKPVWKQNGRVQVATASFGPGIGRWISLIQRKGKIEEGLFAWA